MVISSEGKLNPEKGFTEGESVIFSAISIFRMEFSSTPTPDSIDPAIPTRTMIQISAVRKLPATTASNAARKTFMNFIRSILCYYYTFVRFLLDKDINNI